MSAYDDLVAQATAALNECDHKITAAKARIEELKQEIVGLQLERRKIAALIPSATPAAWAPRSAGAPASVTGGAFVCAECDRSFVSPQAISMHGRKAGHATGYVKGQGAGAGVGGHGPKPAAVVLVEEPPTEADLAALGTPEDDVEPPADGEGWAPEALVADVLAFWAEMEDVLPLERARKIGTLCGVSAGRVRDIVRQHSTAQVA